MWVVNHCRSSVSSHLCVRPVPDTIISLPTSLKLELVPSELYQHCQKRQISAIVAFDQMRDGVVGRFSVEPIACAC